MRIYQLLKIGRYHSDFCEDFTLVLKQGENKLVCAVMDGCTMGQESHFAATLMAKIIRKVIKERQYHEFYGSISADLSLQEELHDILAAVFLEFRNMKSQLLLDTSELLTTLVLGLINASTQEVYGLAIGDATVAINGQLIRFEQDNTPDYLAYHLGQDFEKWYGKQKQFFQATACTDVSLATDGIDSFQNLDSVASDPINVARYLLIDQELCERDEMLNIKTKRLENRHSLSPTDDVAIVRVMLG
ncbi:protein phosphatase 2C domain-containing protein [Hymenobacter tenuis]